MKNFITDRSASVLPMFALMIIPVMAIIGMVVDYTRFSQSKAKLQNVADAAVLAASVEVDRLGAKAKGDADLIKQVMQPVIEDFIQANIGVAPDFSYQINEMTFDPQTRALTTKVDLSLDTSFLRVIGRDQINTHVETVSIIPNEATNAMSLYFVLDRSGSMEWFHRGERKIVSLRKAVRRMHRLFNELDPSHQYVRTGVGAYNLGTTGTRELVWGSQHVRDFLNILKPYGGTNSYPTMASAVQALLNEKEDRLHRERSGKKPKKIILFMTDGANNKDISDHNTRQVCNQAKENNIEVYSVAFTAPHRGRELLKNCASSENHYFDTRNSAELQAAFDFVGQELLGGILLTK